MLNNEDIMNALNVIYNKGSNTMVDTKAMSLHVLRYSQILYYIK